MAQSIEIPVSLGLQQAESQVNHLRKILNEAVKIDSTAFRGLSQALQKAENDVAKLKSQMNTAFQSVSGSKKFLSDYDKLFESLATIGNRFGFLKESEMIFSPENAEAIKNARTEMAQLSDEIQQIKSGKVGKLFEDDSVESIRQVREVANEVGVTLSKTTFQDFSQKISGAMTSVQKDLDDTRKQIELVKQAAQSADLKKDSIFSQLNIDKLRGNTSEVIDKNGASTLRKQITELYDKYGLTDAEVGKNIKAGSNIDQVWKAEEARVSASTDKFVDKLNEEKKRIQEAIDNFSNIYKNTAEGKRANWQSKLAYTDKIKEQFEGLLSFTDASAELRSTGKGIDGYVKNFEQELKQGFENLSTTDIARVLQTKVQEIFSNPSTKFVITDLNSFKQQITVMMKETFGDLNLGDVTKGISAGWDFDKAIEMVIANIKTALQGLDPKDLEGKAAQYEATLQRLTNASKTVSDTERASTGSLKEKEAAFQALVEEVTKYVAAQLGITTGQVQEALHGNTDAANQGRTALEGYIQSLNKLTQKQQALGNIQSAVNRWMGFWQVLNMTKSAINEMKQHIQELDSVMTSISVVTNFSQEDLWGQISQYSEIARQYGVAIKGVYEVSQIYYQQGLQQNDVMTLTTETLKMARIAGLDYATAADYMTTAIRGFKLEMTDAAHVTDVFSALAATTASSTEEIAVAISKTAASAEAVGASFEATSAMMATMISTTRESATNIGTALKSVISRYGEMTSDPSKTVDSEGEEMSLNRVDKALQTVGITIHDTAGQFRDFDDVMLELMEKWDSLDSLSQRYIATLMAGNRQQSRFLALVSNVDEYKKALQTAMDSEGTGELQTLKTLDSIDAKIEKMKVTIQEFYTSSGLEELYKGVLDSITNVVSAANSLPKTFGKIPVQALAVGMSIVNVIKSVITLIISEIQAGLQQIQGKAANTFEGLIIQATAQGEEIGKGIKTGIERGVEGAGSTIGSQLKGMILRNVGAIASLVGSVLTLKGFNEYGASTSEKADQLAGVKTFSGGILGIAGSAISGAATGAMMGSAAGPGGIAVGAVLGGIKGLISNFATLASGIDMMNVTLARQIELSKKRVESAQEEELRAKNSEKNLSQAVEKLKELEEHRYDSIESEKEYYDYMAQLADSYPEYINSINEAGNAIIHSTDLEVALASAREITAQKTLAATEAELEQSKLQLEAYKNFNSNLATLGETSDVLEIGFQAAKKYGTGNQVYERLFTAYNMAHPESTIDIGTANTWQAENKARDLWTTDPQIREQILTWAREEGFTRPTSDNDKKNDFIQALDNIISESDNELSYKQLTGGLAEDAAGIRKLTSEQLQQAISRATNMAQDYIDSQSAAIDNITKLYTQEQFDQKVLTSLSKEDQGNKTILDQYKNLLSFGLNAQFADMDVKDIPADQWEDAFFNLSQWIINNQDAALALMNIDYSQYVDAEEIKKSIPNYEGLDENIRAKIEKNLDDTRATVITLYENQIEGIFKNKQIEEWLKPEYFTTRTLTAIQSDLKQYQSLIKKQQYAQAEAYLNNMKAIYGPEGIGGLSGKNQTKAYDIIKDLDLSDPEALRSAAEAFAGMGSDFEGLSEIFINAALRWTTNAATLLEQLASATKDTAKSIESSLSDMSKVFKYSEALEKAQALMDANEGVKFDELFTYDKDLGGYIKTAKAFQLEMAEFQNQQIEGIQQAITDTTVTLPKALKSLNYDRLAMDYAGSKHTDQNIAQRSIKEGKQTLSSLTGITDSADLDRLWMQYTQMMQEFDALEEADKDWNAFVDKYIQEHGEALQLQLDEINNMSSQMASLQLESFDYASIVSGKGTAQSKESMQALLTQAIDPAKFKLNQDRFNEEYAKLITGDLDSWNTYIDELNTKTGSNIAHANNNQANRARFEGLTSLYQKIASGDVIWDALTQQEQELLNSVEGVNLAEGASAAQVGAAADNVWAAIIKLINAGAGTLNEVADTIAGKADKDFKDSNAGKQYNLLTSYKDGFTSQEAQELGLLDDNGKLKAEFSSYLERDSNGNWVAKAGQNAASVIQNLARLLNISIDKTTDEYKDAIKEGIDQAIAEADKADIGKQRVNAWQSIMSGKVTDRISLANVDNTTKSYMKAAGLISDMNADFIYIQSEEQLNNAIEWMRSKLSDQSFVQENQQTARYFQQLVSDFESKTAKNAAFEGIVGEQFNQSAAEALSMALQNTTEYSKVQSLMTELGFKWDQAAQVWKASAESIKAARQKIAQSHLAGEIDSEEYYQLQAQLNETANAINPKTKQDNVILDMLSNYTEASEAIKAAFKTQFGAEIVSKGLNLNNIFKANDNGTYDIDVGALKSFLDSISFAYDEAAMSQIQTITDSYLNNIKTATTYTTQGASSLADIDAFKQSYADIVGKTLSDDAFSYNSVLQSFVLDESYMDEYINAQREKLRQLNYSEEFIEQYIKDQTDRAIQDSIALDEFLNATTSTERNDEANKLIQQIRGLSNYQGITKSIYQSLYGQFGGRIWAEATEEEIGSTMLHILESGGQAAVDLLKQIKPKASSDELEAVYNNAINKLRTAQEDLGKGVGETISGLAADIGETTGALGVVRLNDGTAVITAVHDMVSAYAAIYTAMEETAGHTTADLNSAYVDMLTAASQNNVTAKETLENAYSMSYQAFGELMDQYGLNMKEVLSNVSKYGRIINDGFGNLRIEDFNQFAKGMGWDINSPEFAESYSAWIDAKVKMQNKPAEMVQSAADQLKSIAEAKPGEAVNVSYLQKQLNLDDSTFNMLFSHYGGLVKEGMLQLSQKVDIPGLITAISNQAAEAGRLLPEQLAELQDTIEGLLNEITNLITNGIEGKLSNADAQQLTNWAKQYGVQDLDFSRTSEGLKLSSTSAKELYNTISEIDSIQGNIVFDALKDSLIESNEQLRSVASTTTYIQTLTKQLETLRAAEKTPDNAKRIANLEKELALAKKINETRSIDTKDDSFNFMSNDIPEGQNNPLNYWKNWTDAFSTIKKSMKGGKAKNTMAYKDFYNIITEMGNIASLTDQGITWGERTLKNSQQAADLITEAAGALKSIDGELVVDLSKIHMDINTSGLNSMATDVDNALNQFAEQQKSMLDSIIAVLEVIVAMEDLKNLDLNEDLDLDLSELGVHVDPGDPSKIVGVDTQLQTTVDNLLNLKATMDDGTSVLEAITLSTGTFEFTLKEFLENYRNVEWLNNHQITSDMYDNLWSNLFNLNVSDLYKDKEQTLQSVEDLLNDQDWGEWTLNIKSKNRTVHINDKRTLTVDWQHANYDALKNQFTQYQGQTDEKIRAAIEEEQATTKEMTLELNTKVRLLNNNILETEDENKQKVWKVSGHNETYSSPEQAAAAADLYDIGVKDVKKTGSQVPVKSSKGEDVTIDVMGGKLTVGAVEMEVTSEGAGVIYSYKGYTGKSIQDIVDRMIGEQAGDFKDSGMFGEDEAIIHNSAAYQEFYVQCGFSIKPIITYKDQKGKTLLGNIDTNEQIRNAVRDFIDNSNGIGRGENQYEITGETVQVHLKDGITYTIPKANLQFEEGTNKLIPESLMNYFQSSLGVDLGLKDTITQGVKEAFSALPEAINSIEPTKITSVSDALKGISSTLDAVVKDTNWDALIAKLGEVASAASGIKLPTGNGNDKSKTPAPSNKRKFPAPWDLPAFCSTNGAPYRSSEDTQTDQEEVEQRIDDLINKANTALTTGKQTLTTTGASTGAAMTESFVSAVTNGLNTLSEGITEAVDSVIKSYTDLETRTEQVAGTIRSHWEALVDQITSAVSLIQSLVQSLQEKISITWTIGSEGGKSDLAGSGSGVDLDPTRGVTALTEYMDKMLSTMEHNKKDDTFKVTMPTLTIDTSTTKVNIDDIGTKVQEEAAKEPVKEVKVSVGTITADLDNVNVDVASINEKVNTETKANPIPSLDTLVNSITPDLTGTTVDTAGINTKVQAEVAKNPIPNLDVVVNTITPDVSETVPDDVDALTEPLIIKSARAKIKKLADPLDLTEINDLGVQTLNENASMVLTDVKAVPTSLSLSLGDTSNVSIDEATPVVLSEPIKIPAEVDIKQAETDIDTLKTKIGEIKQESKPKIFVDINPAISILNALYKVIDEIKQKKIPQITVDTEVAKNSLNQIIGILNTIIEKAQSLMIRITTAQETYQTSELIKTIMKNLITINNNKTITISIGGGSDWQKLISDLNAIAKALERIKGASGIDIDINGGPKETPEEGETPKEGETPQEKQSTTTTEVSQQTKVTTPNGTEIEMNAKVVATEVDGSQAPPMDAQANVTSASMASGAQPLQTAAEVNSAEAAQGTTVAIQASIEMGDAGQNLQLTATYTATVVNQPADANNLKANYQAIVTGAPGNIHGLKAYYTAVLERGLGGCFVAGTQITMADGTTKNIENIQVGDQVISYNTTTNEFVIGIVNKAYVHHNTSELIKVLLSDGTSIILTPGHPLLSTRGWKSRDIENSLYEHNTIATWLNIGDILIKQDHNASVISIENINVPEHYDTYNAEVDVYHTFIANGIVAHNRKASADAIRATGNFGLASGTLGLASDTLGRITGPAHAQSTLMGELGPELVISDGRYFVVGQDGAEMVDLDEDAIVFNHLQTEQLLKNGMSKGRGRAVTNERNAVAFAKGNISGGPAMASASAALAALKQLRSMWQSLLSATAKDLAGAGGSGGGGGGGGGDKGDGDPGTKSFIEQVERWYNLMQEIAKLEKVINHEETLRAKLESDLYKNGKAYYKSQKESLSAIQGSIVAQEKLNLSRREFFNQRREELNNDNGPFTQLYEFDPQGQLKYKEPTNIRGSSAQNGYAFLADLMKQHDTGQAKYTVEEQYRILEQAGFSEYMKYDSSGNEIKLGGEGEHKKEDYDTYYSSMVQAFWDRVEAQKSEMQTLYDTIAEGENNLLELEQQRNDLLQAMYDNQRELEDSVLSAIEDMRQREIDALQDERDKLEEATGKYIDGLSEALDKERQMYDTQENQNELNTKKRRLGILQRSGASAEDIYSLQKEITESEKNMYFDAQQAQIDAIQQASNLEIERLDTQIQIMQDTLDFQKEMGLLWYKVYEVMGKSSGEITNFVMGNDSQFWAKSPLESKQTYEKTLFEADQWKSFAADQQNISKMLTWDQKAQTAEAFSTYSQNMASMHGQDWDASGRYSKVFEETFQKTGDRTKAAVEASKAFEADAEWRRREQEGGAEFIGTGEEKYVDIDDNQHWKYTYRHEMYGGNNPQYMGQTNYYFVSKVKENHNWVNGVCSKCGHQQPPNSRGGGGWSSNNCSDNCSGVCKGQLSGGDNRSTGAVWIGQGKGCMGCTGQCSGGCTNSCKGGPNDKVGGYTPKKKKGRAAGINNDVSLAKGNRTLIGELGPELVVSNGQYHIAGQSGAEFINLPDDAIVFNHMQTRSLLQNGHTGRGKSVLSDARSIASSDTNQVVEWKNSLLSKKVSHPASFAKAALDKISATWNTLTTNAQTQSTGNIIIENATVNMNVQKIANDYDAKRAGEQALNEMLRIANKTSAANNIRR